MADIGAAKVIYLFLYRVDFPPFANPSDLQSQFAEGLRAFLKARRLRCLVGAQGGKKTTYGVVYRKRWGVNEAHRIALADWIKVQRIRCTARLGVLEEDSEETDYLREITEWIFEVDNLTKEDRKAAAADKKKRERMFEKLKRRATKMR